MNRLKGGINHNKRLYHRCKQRQYLAYWRLTPINDGRALLDEYVMCRIHANYRRITGESSGRRLGQVSTTSIWCTQPPHARHLVATAKELETLAGVNVLKVTASFNKITAHYKTRRFHRILVITQ